MLPPDTYRDLILNARQPLRLRGVPLAWPCLDPAALTIHQWAAQFDANLRYADTDAGAQFNYGRGTATGRHPQWERTLCSGSMQIAEFLQRFADDKPQQQQQQQPAPAQWATLNYRNLREMPEECRRGIGLTAIGLQRDDPEQFTFWLGSRGAHTPCHYDTYGCNVVVQVYGSKSWMLMAPTARLTAQRVPYEESSVYSAENWHSPPDARAEFGAAVAGEEEAEAGVWRTVLEPGDVLVVPPKWWHYAENESVSLSINSWLPVESDLDAHLEECIVRANVAEYTRNLSRRQQQVLINPNELDTIHSIALPEQLRLLDHIAKYLHDPELRAKWPVPSYKHNYLSAKQWQQLVASSSPPDSDSPPPVSLVPQLSTAQFYAIMEAHSARCDPSLPPETDSGAGEEAADTIRMCAQFINATCSPANVERVKLSILRRCAKPV